MIVAGEPSGDAHGAALIAALKQLEPETEWNIFGATGPLLRSAGVDSIVRSDDLSIMGLVEVGRALPRFWHAFKSLKQAAVTQRPDAVILVDWPDFNMRLARSLHRQGLRIIYYISPQLWAWRSYRKKSIRRDVDLLLSILPFEKDWYIGEGFEQVEFVGHPLVDKPAPAYGREEFCRAIGLNPDDPIVSLLPGSRHKELQRILPPMLDATALILREKPKVQFVLVVAPSRSPDEAKEILAKHAQADLLAPKLKVVHERMRETLAASDAAAIASGTATLEAALLETPMVVVYKESPINWHVLGSLINTDHFGLVNLVAGERIVTELMQTELTGPRLAEELVSLLDGQRNQEVRNRLADVRHKLGEAGASRRAAQSIVKALDSWRQ
jgi:lipid-A-disaccharide synthase